MADSITLSSATRSNLLSLQRTTDNIATTQERLSTGRKVNSALDDALAFFKSRGLNDRASDLATVKDGISEAINVVKAAVTGLESIEGVLKQMKALASAAKAESDSSIRSDLQSQYNALYSQIDDLAEDADYNGQNLLETSAQSMTVKFNEETSTALKASFVISAQSSESADLSVTTQGTWASQSGSALSATIDTTISNIESSLSTVRANAQTLGTDSSMLEIRRDFTDNLMSTLKSGAGDLVNADMNEESANMLSLQTRQQLGTISLSIAQQSEQSILRLF